MPHPTDIKLHQRSKILEVAFDSGETFKLPCEYLRVYSQSAEVTGHAPGQEVLQVGKQDVNIENITPVGNYAVKLHFDDGHDSGIYTWERLYDLGKNQEEYWVDYLRRLMRAGHDHEDLQRLKAQNR
ncbi:gamma-butyrobetaine hydroxylase-like domain-containing protein [Thiomicrorhabdus sp.]|uniref:gamma-butyrobetaine hydroxylase-like domain-containing protein n=1 Tax=Thiomicrorhabdus sp. TaxID=2039724 RepID=UPI003561AA4F